MIQTAGQCAEARTGRYRRTGNSGDIALPIDFTNRAIARIGHVHIARCIDRQTPRCRKSRLSTDTVRAARRSNTTGNITHRAVGRDFKNHMRGHVADIHGSGRINRDAFDAPEASLATRKRCDDALGRQLRID